MKFALHQESQRGFLKSSIKAERKKSVRHCCRHLGDKHLALIELTTMKKKKRKYMNDMEKYKKIGSGMRVDFTTKVTSEKHKGDETAHHKGIRGKREEQGQKA